MQPNGPGRRRLKRTGGCAEAFPEMSQVTRITSATINEIEYKQRECRHTAVPIEELDETALDLFDAVHGRCAICGQKGRRKILAGIGFILSGEAGQRQGDGGGSCLRYRRTGSHGIWQVGSESIWRSARAGHHTE